jgi:branched-chain amino acid transport system substrate-binding protein
MKLVAALIGLLFAAFDVRADLTIGVILPLTGPAAALGIPCKNALALWPESIAGEKLKFIVLDDASDPTTAIKNARRLVTEDRVDLILGSASVPTSIAISDVADEGQTVQLALSPIELPDGRGAWTFRLPQSSALMAAGIMEHMKKTSVRSIGFLGYADPYGETWLKAITKEAQDAGIKIVAVERFARADTSVAGQALKVIAANPDAVLVVASGSGAAMPHRTLIERGFKGKIYQTHSAASKDLTRLGGKDVEGGYVISGPAVVPEQLPDNHPSKKVGLSFVEQYEKKYGPESRNQFSAHVNDALLVLQRTVPVAVQKGTPGTKAFHGALKDALETGGEITISQGVIKYTAQDHFGLDARARVLLTIQSGNWKIVETK